MSDIPAHVKRLATDRDLAVAVRLGRSGLTGAITNELRDQLARRAVVKVKATRVWDDRQTRQAMWEALAEACGATLVQVRGSVAVFWRRR